MVIGDAQKVSILQRHPQIGQVYGRGGSVRLSDAAGVQQIAAVGLRHRLPGVFLCPQQHIALRGKSCGQLLHEQIVYRDQLIGADVGGIHMPHRKQRVNMVGCGRAVRALGIERTVFRTLLNDGQHAPRRAQYTVDRQAAVLDQLGHFFVLDTVVRSVERLRVGADVVLLPVDERPAAVRHKKLPVAVLGGGEILPKSQALQLIGIADLLDAVGQHPGRKPVRLKAVFHRYHETGRVRSFIILDPQSRQVGGVVLPCIAKQGQVFPHFGDVAFPGILIKDIQRRFLYHRIGFADGVIRILCRVQSIEAQHPAAHGGTVGIVAVAQRIEHGIQLFLTEYAGNEAVIGADTERIGHADAVIGMGDTILPQRNAVRIGEHILCGRLLLIVYQRQLGTHPLFGIGGPRLRRFPGERRRVVKILCLVFHRKVGGIGIEYQPDGIVFQRERFACRCRLPRRIVLGGVMLRCPVCCAAAGTAG